MYLGISKTGEKCQRGTEVLRKEEKGVGKYLATEIIVTWPSFMIL